MINEKYYNDIKKFPTQFEEGYKLAEGISLEKKYDKVLLCGMGGSSLYADLINDYLGSFSSFRINVAKSYELPNWVNEKTLVIVASYSGNTEETLACLDEVMAKNLDYVIFTSGGKLLAHAEKHNSHLFKLPGGIQPRLSTGFFIAAMLSILEKTGLVENKKEEVLTAANNITASFNEEDAKKLAKELENKAPIIYSTDNNSSIALISKIKFNENAKTQSFWNYFPELNHNEMVGYTNLVMDPYFIIYESKFTNERNKKRIEIFSKLMEDKGLGVNIIKMSGNNVLEEILSSYFYIDHVTYYLAESTEVDPEPVAMVEEFKALLA